MGDLINRTADLQAACAIAKERGILALDTEFVWRRTYRPQLGIVQIGSGSDQCYALDCGCGMDVSSLGELLADDSVVKILHDARQDLVLLHHYTGVSAANVFDTQVAAAFAGFPSGIGLQKLLFEALDVGLAKTETCTDWIARPLSPAQVEYALDDVRYLPALRDELISRAEKLGTREWMEEELTRYDDPAMYGEIEHVDAWKRIRIGRGFKMSGVSLAVLRELAAVREETAEKWDMPRNWLGDDASLCAMAEKFDVAKLKTRLKGGKEETVKAFYASAIARAKDTPEAECPADTRKYYIAEVLAAADKAMEWLAEKAQSLHVDAGMLATRAVVTAFVDDVLDETNPLAFGWRWEAIGREMAEKFAVE